MLQDVEPDNQSTCPRQEKAKVEAARLEEVEEHFMEELEEVEEQHERVRGEKLDSWRCLSCLRVPRMGGTRWSPRLSPTRTCHQHR